MVENKKEIIKKLGSRIKQLRIIKGLKRRHVKELLKDNLWIETYSKIECGCYTEIPTEKTLKIIAKMLEIEPYELLSIVGKVDSEIAAIINSNPKKYYELIKKA